MTRQTILAYEYGKRLCLEFAPLTLIPYEEDLAIKTDDAAIISWLIAE